MSKRTCHLDECSKPLVARGLCGMHYARWRKDPSSVESLPPFEPRKDCAVETCGNVHHAKGFCSFHYDRSHRLKIDLLAPKVGEASVCSQDGCGRKHMALGLCGKHYSRQRWLLEKYGLTATAYQSLLDSQGGFCAICGQGQIGADDMPLAVDHDHDTGEVRGLLCNPCNAGIGQLKESPELLRAAADYLELPLFRGSRVGA